MITKRSGACLRLAVLAALALAVLLTVQHAFPLQASAAPSASIVDSSGAVAVHRNSTVGSSPKAYAAVVRGAEASGATYRWASSSPRVARAEGSGESSEVVTVSEGVAEISVEIRLAGGEILTDSFVFCAFTAVEEAGGVLSAEAPLTRAALEDAGRAYVRCVAGAGQELVVVGRLGSFWRVRLPQDFEYADPDGAVSPRTSYVPASAISIPATSLAVEPIGRVRLREGETLRLTAHVEPEISTDAVSWSSSDDGIASVGWDGVVEGVRFGRAMLAASCGNLKMERGVVVYKDTESEADGTGGGTFLSGTTPWVSAVGNKSIVVHWYECGCEQRYDMLYRRVGETAWQKAATITTTNDAQRKYRYKGLKPGKHYDIFVKPNVGAKTDNCTCKSATKKLTKKTRKSTMAYFKSAEKREVAHKTLYGGVYVTKRRASDRDMSLLRVQLFGTACRPYVKYNYCTAESTLYIHIYVNISGKGASQRFSYEDGKSHEKSSVTYEQLFLQGVKRAYSIYALGNSKDFDEYTGIRGKTVRFATKVRLHPRHESFGKQTAQSYIDVFIGDTDCGTIHHDDCSSWKKGYYWHHAHASGSFVDAHGKKVVRNAALYGNTLKSSHTKNKYSVRTTARVYLPTNKVLASDYKKSGHNPERSPTAWGSCCAHEIGHALGLDDAYDLVKKFDRLTPGNETSYKVALASKGRKATYRNIMTGFRRAQKAKTNDIEMILHAYRNASKGKAARSWQSYKRHTVDGEEHPKSKAVESE